MKRQGFALISSIVIASFLLVTVVAVSAMLTSQLRSQSLEGLSRKAFYYAEAALQDSFSAACNTGDATGIRSALLGTTPVAYDGPAKMVAGDSGSFTWIKAKPVFSGVTVVRYEFVAMGVVCDSSLSGLSSADLKAGIGYSVLSRRVIKMLTAADFDSKDGNVFQYGLLAGSGIIQNGNSAYHAPQGPVDLYAGTNITMKTSSFDADIDIYAHGTVKVKSYSGVLQEHADQVTLPPINLAYWQTQFKAFLDGTAPYNGNPQYMDMRPQLVKDAVGKYISRKSATSGYLYTTPSEVANLIAALKFDFSDRKDLFFLITDPVVYKQLQDTVSKTVFYVQDSASSLNATIPDRPFSGVLVCPGQLTFDSKSVFDSTGAVFMSKGNLTFNGSGKFQGTFYTEGTFLHNGSTSELYGSVIALQGDIRFNGASKDTNLVNYAAGNTEAETQFSLTKPIGSGWSEVDLSKFSSF